MNKNITKTGKQTFIFKENPTFYVHQPNEMSGFNNRNILAILILESYLTT